MVVVMSKETSKKRKMQELGTFEFLKYYLTEYIEDRVYNIMSLFRLAGINIFYPYFIDTHKRKPNQIGVY